MSDVPSYPADAAERESSSAPASSDREYSGWWRRVGAYLVDAILIGLAILVLGVVLYLAAVEAAIAVAYLLYILLPFAYFAYFHSRTGQTPGKSLLGIRVVTESDGQPLSFGRAFGRYALMFLLGILVLPSLIDYLWPLWDSKNQSLHDKVVSSVVVRA